MIKKIFNDILGLQFLKFLIVGVSNTLVTIITIWILMKVFSISYLIANPAGYILGLINSFIWNKIWVFKSSKKDFREILYFTAVFLISFGVQYIFVLSLVEVFNLPSILDNYTPYKNFNEVVPQILGMGPYTFTNFLGNKFFTFKKNAHGKEINYSRSNN